MNMNRLRRQAFELAIAKELIYSILSQDPDFHIGVSSSGDERDYDVLSNAPGEILAAIFAVDDCNLTVEKQEKSFGWIHLIQGNDGYDLIADYSGTSLIEKLVKTPERLADRLENSHHFLPSEAQIDAAMDALYFGENWREDLGPALETAREDLARALISAHYEI